MSTWRLQSNQPNLWEESGPGINKWEWGVRFNVASPCYLESLAWWRYATGGTRVPSIMRLWDGSTQSVIYTVGVIPDSATVGWQRHTVSTSVLLVPGRVYVASFGYETNVSFPYTAGSNRVSPVAPFNYETNFRGYSTMLSFGYPATTDQVNLMGIDVGVSSQDPSVEPPLTDTEDNNNLASWLISTDDNTHKLDGLPWLSYEALQLLQTGLTAARDAIDTNQDYITAALGPAGTLASGAVRTLLDRNLGEIDKILDLADSVLKDRVDGIDAKLDAIGSAIANPVTPAPPAAPSATWVITASGSETGEAILTEPADFYNITVTARGGDNRVNTYAGQDFLTFNWWWVPIRGAAVGQWHTSRGLVADLYEPGRRLPGVLVAMPDDFEWDWEAWSYVPA